MFDKNRLVFNQMVVKKGPQRGKLEARIVKDKGNGYSKHRV